MLAVTLRDRLRAGPPLLATLSIVAAPEIVELLALAGFDAVVLDTEHGPFGTESLPPLILAARSRGLSVLVRVRSADPSLIGAALDAGADGVVVPQVASGEQARTAVRAARFAPEGTRGANPFVRAADFGSNADFFATANSKAAVIVMVEGREGLAQLPEILETPNLDGVLVGPIDLSHALGVPGEIEHHLVLDAARDVIKLAAEKGVCVGMFTPTPTGAQRWLALGVPLVVLGVEATLLLEGLRAAVDRARS